MVHIPGEAAQSKHDTPTEEPNGAIWSWCDWACEALRDSFGQMGEPWASHLGRRPVKSTMLTLEDLPVFELAVQAKLLHAIPGRAKALQRRCDRRL